MDEDLDTTTASSPDAARWTADLDGRSDPPVRSGRSPHMTYMAWRRSQSTEIGGTAADAWYWRCRDRSCRVWSGPYADLMDAKSDGTDHQGRAHTTNLACRPDRCSVRNFPVIPTGQDSAFLMAAGCRHCGVSSDDRSAACASW
jgi:hypothetical protein